MTTDKNPERIYSENYTSQHRNGILFASATFALSIWPDYFELHKLAFIKDGAPIQYWMPLIFCIATIYSTVYFCVEWWDLALTHRRNIISVIKTINKRIDDVLPPINSLQEQAIKFMNHEADSVLNINDWSQESSTAGNLVWHEFDNAVTTHFHLMEKVISFIKNTKLTVHREAEMAQSQINSQLEYLRDDRANKAILDGFDMFKSATDHYIDEGVDLDTYFDSTIFSVYDEQFRQYFNEMLSKYVNASKYSQHKRDEFIDNREKILTAFKQLSLQFTNFQNRPIWEQRQLSVDSAINWMRVYGLGIGPSLLLCSIAVICTVNHYSHWFW